MNKKIVFCGGGNMAEGVIRSLVSRKVAAASDITVSELNPQRCEYLKDTYKVAAVTDATQAMAEADVVVIAVLPKIVPVVTRVLKDIIRQDAVVLSIAAGIRISALEEQLGSDKKVVRVMPNTLNQSGNGFSAVSVNDKITEEDKEYVTKFLDALGQTMYINEDMFGAFTAFSCSGPMWIYQMADALVDAGVYVGFSRADATEIVIRNLLGVSYVLNESGDAPKERVNEMCSPAGVTIEGYKSLQEEGFTNAVMTSVKRAVDKANSIK